MPTLSIITGTTGWYLAPRRHPPVLWQSVSSPIPFPFETNSHTKYPQGRNIAAGEKVTRQRPKIRDALYKTGWMRCYVRFTSTVEKLRLRLVIEIEIAERLAGRTWRTTS